VFTYVLGTDIGRVRRTIPDKEEDDAFWTDEDIQSFLDDEGDWRRASAACLESMAADSALVLQVIQVQDLRTNGAETARILLTRAKLLREQATTIDNDGDGEFDIIPMAIDDFGYRELVSKNRLR
jgi:hypothetical protein